MKERLQEILRQEHLTPARFAELVGVQRSSVSHILSGRNNPSLDFLQKILASFEHINPDWLITGNGPYKRSELFKEKEFKEKKNTDKNGQIHFPENESVNEEQQIEYIRKKKNSLPNSNAEEFEKNSKIKLQSGTNPDKKIVKTILFYDDNTFDVFFPA